ELGRLSAAVPHFHQALELVDRAENPHILAIALGNSAMANWAAGYQDVALRQYGDLLELARRNESTLEEAVALHGIASVYNKVGDQTRALDFYRQTLTVRRAALCARG